MIDVFISHSSKDSEFVDYLVDFLRVGLRLSRDQILATSVELTQKKVGSKIDSLRRDIKDTTVFIVVLSVELFTPTQFSWRLIVGSEPL